MNRLLTAAIAGSAALATATGGLAAGLAAGIATATPQATAPKAAATAERIDWGRCASPGLRELGLECGRLAVPLDHSEPDGEQISLALSRLKATAPASQQQGALIGEFRFFPVFSQLLGERITAEYDLIGFDFRGTGQSKPLLDCGGKDPFRAPQPAYLPTADRPDDNDNDDDGPLGLGGIGVGGSDDGDDNDDDNEPGANERAWLDRWETFTDRCADKYGDELAHYNSTVDALDIEAVRVALGAPKISLYTESGYSREIYASEFGDRVHRVVLATAPDSRRAGYQGLLDDVDTETEHIDRFWAWIASHHDVYRLGRTADAVEAEYRAVERQLTRNPVKKFGPAEWSDAILFGAVFTELTWPDVASDLAAWVRGNRKPILRNAATPDTLSTTSQVTAYCGDGEPERDYDRWRADAFEAAEDAPDFAWRDTLNYLGCLTWPAQREVDADGSGASMLIVSGEDDQMRHEGALGLRERFPNSAYLTVTDSITDPVFTGSTCVDKAVKRYLKDGTLPDREDGDEADASCTKPKLPKPLKKDRERAQ